MKKGITQTPESLQQVAARAEDEATFYPADIVIKIPIIGLDYIQTGMTNTLRAVRMLRDAADRLEML